MSDSEEEIEVNVINYKGTKFFLDKKTNKIYDAEDNEHIGTFNPSTKEIEFFPDEEEALDEEEAFKKKAFDEDLPVKFKNPNLKEYKNMGIFGFKTVRSNRVYSMALNPVGIYDPKTRKIDTSKKPPPILEDDEEDLDAMIDALDKEIDELDIDEYED